LNRGWHVYSEKPIAATVAEAESLATLAESKGLHLLCAPAVMVTNRMQWLKKIVTAGRIGKPHLAVAQMANMGPHAWRAYTGDPRVHYSAGVGPMIDTGVYLLHAITGMLGAAKRIQAMGGITVPKRTILVDAYLGEEIEVGSNDVMMIHLDFGDNVFAQVLSTFAVPRTKQPAFELHGALGTISLASETWYNTNGPADILLRDESPIGLEDWQTVSPPVPSPHTNLIGAGVPHLVGVLAGKETPILTARHATHVLEIMLKATESATTRETIDLSTTF
jgi:predicted dehydrogenase